MPTAAHYIHNVAPYVHFNRQQRIINREPEEAQHESYQVTGSRVFDKTKANNHNGVPEPERTHDIALLKINRVEGPASPILLEDSDDSLEVVFGLRIVGWGDIAANNVHSDVARVTNLEVYNKDWCMRLNTLTPSLDFCLGSFTHSELACRGDSGAPAFYFNNNGNPVLVGVLKSSILLVLVQ